MMLDPATSTWCWKHHRLEAVDLVESAEVYKVAGAGGELVPAVEVMGRTFSHCPVHFIGGERWTPSARNPLADPFAWAVRS